jgi:phosphopantothenoylcysteine decarboxylase / phosphopantothenate---cysteine ligase
MAESPSVKVVLGVTGGIAAYKAADVVRGLIRRGADVTVIMTDHARHFVTPLTLQTLSGRRVITSHFDPIPGRDAAEEPADVEHVGLSRACRLLLVAPATANILAKMAAGIADDFLSTFYLAVACPVVVAPAMNTRMWDHAAVAANLARLRERGVHVVGPESGALASPGEGEGMGRMSDPDTIVARAFAILGGGGPLSGRTVLVTAGPTREEIDPVRFLSNPSTGRMGFAIAVAARDLGAKVVLVAGPTSLADPGGVTTVRVTSAEEMRAAVMAHLKDAQVIVKAAAVSDFRPAARSPQKVKKGSAPRTIELEPTADILAEIGRNKAGRFLVGFAAETESLMDNARRKLTEKGLDLIVANDVSPRGAGFGSETNEVVVIGADGGVDRWPRMSKAQVAARLMALVASRLGAPAPGR